MNRARISGVPVLFLALVLGVGTVHSQVAPDQARMALQDPNRLLLRGVEFDTRQGEPPMDPGLRIDAYAPGELGYYIVQFVGPVVQAWKDEVQRLGGELLDYLPNNAFVVRMDDATLGQVSAASFVRWVGIFQPAYKVDSEIGRRTFQDPNRGIPGPRQLVVELFELEDPAAVAPALTALGAQVTRVIDEPSIKRLELLADPALVGLMARLNPVRWIEEVGEITRRNNVTKWVIQSNVQPQTPVWEQGLHGEGQIIGHIDGKIDLNHCSFDDIGGAPPGPAHRKIVGYRSSSGAGPPFDSHGTHTAGTAAGDQSPVTGLLGFNGMGYKAKLSFGDLDDITLTNLAPAFVAARADGARIHTNSWGDDGTTAYTTWVRDIDLFSQQNEDHLVVFAVTNLANLKTPENAKNVLAVGASRQAPNQAQHATGGKGPTIDGRRKPEVYAPGQGIQSARSGTACNFIGSTGTSMATPAIAGAAALVRQYFTEGWYPTGSPNPGDARVPSGSLLKAMLINGAVDMTGVTPGGATYPNDVEGWGRLLLENALFFDGQARGLIVRDVRNASGLGTGGQATIPFTVQSNGQALRVTLVWADRPAAVNAAFAPINNLNLEVAGPGGTYRGNVFNATTGESVTGGTADPINNLEVVHVKVPAPGNYAVFVKGASVPMGPQGYAVAITGNVSSGGGGGNLPPVAEANGPYSGKRNIPVSFTSAGSADPDGSIVTFSWNFGDGSAPGTGPNPSHTYTSTGTFTVTLTVTDNQGGADTDTALVKVTR